MKLSSLVDLNKRESRFKNIWALVAVPAAVVFLSLNHQSGEAAGQIIKAAPANDSFLARQTLPGATGMINNKTNVDATREVGEPIPIAASNGKTVWFKWTPTVTGHVHFYATANLDTILAAFIGNSVNTLTLVQANDDSGDNQNGLLSFTAAANVTYSIMVDTKTGPGTFSLTYVGAPIAPFNDNLYAARTLTGSGNAGDCNVYATHEPFEPDHAGVPCEKSVWYRWTATQDGYMEFLAVSDEMDPVIAVYTGLDEDLTLVESNDDWYSATTAGYVGILVEAGQSFTIAVDTKAPGEGGRFRLDHHFNNCESQYGCFIDKAYQYVSGVLPSASAREFWRDNICSEASNAGIMIKALMDTPEYVNYKEFPARCYAGIYNNNSETTFSTPGYRYADLSGWKNWTNVMKQQVANGATLQAAQKSVVGAFISSPEWTTRVGNPTNSAFVDFLYTNILGRVPDPGGKQFHLNRLNTAQTTRKDLVYTFITSPEAVAKFDKMMYVCQGYMSLLDRKPTAQEFKFTGDNLYSGSLPIYHPLRGITGSVEFKQRLAAAGCVASGLSVEKEQSSQSSAYELFAVDKSGTLEGASVALTSSKTGNVHFEVYEYDGSGEASLIAASDKQPVTSDDGRIDSPSLGVPLTPGRTYAVGVHWTGEAQAVKSDSTPLAGVQLLGSAGGKGLELESVSLTGSESSVVEPHITFP